MNINTFLVCVCSFIFLQGLNALILSDIDVPSVVSITNEGVDPITLDCKYKIEGSPTEFIVKWWKDDKLIYQWIYGKMPTAIHPFEDDFESYEASSDPLQQYRGVIMTNPSLESTGVYKCVVRSYEGNDFDEKSMSKKLQVVHTANHTLNLYHHRIDNETHVECSVNDVYPEPKLELTSDDGDPVEIISTKVYMEDNGFFNATTIAIVADDDDDPDAYICTVTFSGLDINLTKTAESGSAIKKVYGFGLWLEIFILLRFR